MAIAKLVEIANGIVILVAALNHSLGSPWLGDVVRANVRESDGGWEQENRQAADMMIHEIAL
ncbi:hypothetical protein GCM10022278_01960 [Allohahella marinimesophila]|uniref:Uncharacterized protein n=1 Tax=Allohahella marinimesophila TaxID=1054972 RepID=A0ABP7NGA1_9GAMM